jgi:hypothetical protein
MASPEHIEELLIPEILESGYLQFQKCVLARVHIDGVHMPNAAQQIVERIATGRGDDEQAILGG